ncbi:serine hydrolase domain-containing protein [Streptomyces sp. NPDC020965]|uniref:serine hydrolase domain-containing protein n=1 Tax=Streptomyces sp. NPDC020965 TaxID=3365105 RepID=UPI0037BBE670
MMQTPNSAPGAGPRPTLLRRRGSLLAATMALTLAPLSMPLSTAWADSGTRSSGYTRADLQRDLDTLTAKDGVVGAQATLVKGEDRIAARSGTAELGTMRPMPKQGFFRMGSNTKTFVSTVILQLVGEGGMKLDDTVEDWLPGMVQGNGHNGDRITVRHLLQHTSGLPDYAASMPGISTADGFQKYRYTTFEPRELVALGLKSRPLFAPGHGWSYSNTGYILAGMIIEKVTGNPWSREVRSRITEPLGLKHTYSPGSDPTLPAPHARAYMQFSEEGPLVEATRLNMSWGDSAGDLITTPHDLARFWQGLLGGELLAPRLLTEMRKTVPATSGSETSGVRAGLGIFKTPLSCGGSSWGHGGTTLGHLNGNGFTDKGQRGVITLRSTNLAHMDRDVRNDRLIDKALCKTR